MTRVSVVEYGIGNITSVVNACGRAGGDPRVARSGDELLAQDPGHIVLPGVGALGAAMQFLRQRGLDAALERLVIERGVPFLGICVGMQMLVEVGEEFGEHACLGWVPGRVRRLGTNGRGLRLPHVGWNTVEVVADDPLLAESADTHFYFLHSYAVDCPKEYVLARTEYGRPFASALRKDNIAAVQFHPEKSSGAGAAFLSAFLAS